ncbi:MAG: V-type ATP synthase subunit A [Candidatus Paceibacterota bacterium]
MANSTEGKITRITGPLVEAEGLYGAKLYEIVRVSGYNLIGEIIELNEDRASIQVYEETGGIKPGDKVELTGMTMSVELGPGLLESIYDGIQRPLKSIEEQSNSAYIKRGIEANALDRDRRWKFSPSVKKGDKVEAGDVLGVVAETSVIDHKIMVPPGIEGEVKNIIKESEVTVEDIVAVLETAEGQEKEVKLFQRWPIRTPRPKKEKVFPEEPLISGTHIIDTFFPVAKGGVAAIPGPFGSGKTVTQQGFAKYCDAQVIIYIGCGERGNEMTDVLNEFPELEDPNTGEPLMKRTVLIANTSNMPVAAREASVYTGITIAEYYRDMGYSVALMADSTSRWAEAMREISGRLEEMPGEEGYPAYLASRTADFYERAGRVRCLGGEERDGALTVIGAVSPPGGDFSEPVSQATFRVTKCFWALDSALAYKKHFPAINWLQSYSLYIDNLEPYWKKEVNENFSSHRTTAMGLLQDESRLLEIVRLVGMESLSNSERLTLEIARSLREDFLFQNALDPDDAYRSLPQQYQILACIIHLHDHLKPVVEEEGFEFERIYELNSVKELKELRTYKNDPSLFEDFRSRAEEEVKSLIQS